MRYLVVWKIDIEGVESPAEAAARALIIQRNNDPANSATVFEVTDDSGQHSECCLDWYYGTRPATPEQYGSLLAELTGIYDDCTLRVVKRINRA